MQSNTFANLDLAFMKSSLRDFEFLPKLKLSFTYHL